MTLHWSTTFALAMIALAVGWLVVTVGLAAWCDLRDGYRRHIGRYTRQRRRRLRVPTDRTWWRGAA